MQEQRKYHYPKTRTDDIVEDFHGTPVPDPYRWLEYAQSTETRAWVDEQNHLTFELLEQLEARGHLRARLTELWDFPKWTVPHKEGDRYFFSYNDGLQNQNVLYGLDTLDSTAVEILDPNRLSDDGTVALTTKSWSEDGRLLAYGASTHGSDWQELYVRRVDDGYVYPEVIKWCKFASIAWKHDNSGFYYARFPEPGSVPAEDQTNFHRVYFHALDTPQEADQLVYERPDAKELGFHPFITDDGAYLVLMVWHGTDPRNRIYYRPLKSSEPFVRLLDDADAMYSFIDNVGTTFYLHTDQAAPRGRIIAIDIAHPERENWREIVPEHTDVIAHVAAVNHQIVVVYKHDVQHQIRLFAMDGTPAGEIALPGPGSIGDLSGKPDQTELFYSFESFLQPPTIFRYDFTDGSTTTFRAPQVDFDLAAYETKQVFYPSRDGTRVPMYITHKRGLELSGDHPTLLYGYGGFNISLMPTFSVSRLAWLEQGGVLAIANMRGGDEYGESWHQAGMLANKQNAFDDFIAAGEWLIAEGYTQSARLAIMGGSNGGLLVAACMLQRPELFGAVVCQVPVTDMLHYHRWTVGRYWIPEYGNAEADPEHFKFMYAYSPLHNVRAGVTYPPLLITSADTDDRVVPAHAKKFAATLQAASNGLNPILLRVETKAGHGLGKPTSKIIEEAADIYAFLMHTFDMEGAA